MRFTTIIPIAAALLSFAAAQATTDEDASVLPPPPKLVQRLAEDYTLEERQADYGNELGVYWCSDPNWKGGCLHQTPKRRACVSIANTMAANLISSFGPDHNTVCDLYEGPDCNGSGVKGPVVWTVKWPGIPDLKTVNLDDKLGSYRCFDPPQW